MTLLDKLKQAAEKELTDVMDTVEEGNISPFNLEIKLIDLMAGFATSESAREYWLSQSKYKQVRLLTSLLIETADKYVKLQEKKSSEE